MNTAAAALLAWAYGEADPGPDDQRPNSDEDYGFLWMGTKSVVLFPKTGDPDLKPEHRTTVWHAEICISGGVRIASETGDTPEEALSALSDAWIALHKTMMEKAPLPHGLVLPVGQEIAAAPRTYLPAAPSPEADRQIAEIRAVYAAYRKGGRVGKIDITAANGYFLPERAGDMHSKAPLWVAALLRELDRVRAELSTAEDGFTELAEQTRLQAGTIENLKQDVEYQRTRANSLEQLFWEGKLSWKPWYPEGVDTSQPPWCHIAEVGQLRAEATRTMNLGGPDVDGEQWHWQIGFVADPGQEDEGYVLLREAGPMLASAGLARQEAEAAYAKLMGRSSTTREKV